MIDLFMRPLKENTKMSRFFWLHLFISFLSLVSIEGLKYQWVTPAPPPVESDVQVIAIPPKPEGVNATEQEEGVGTRYTEQKCNDIKAEYRDICFHQLARQSAKSDLKGAQLSCEKIQ